MLLNIDAHCLDKEFIATLAAQGIEIEDRRFEPWDILFRGTDAALRAMLTDHWGISGAEVDAAMECAIDTDVDVRKATHELYAQAAQLNDLDEAVRLVQDAIGVKTGDHAGMFFDTAAVEAWTPLSVPERDAKLRAYVAYERSLEYPAPFNEH